MYTTVPENYKSRSSKFMKQLHETHPFYASHSSAAAKTVLEASVFGLSIYVCICDQKFVDMIS